MIPIKQVVILKVLRMLADDVTGTFVVMQWRTQYVNMYHIQSTGTLRTHISFCNM